MQSKQGANLKDWSKSKSQKATDDAFEMHVGFFFFGILTSVKDTEKQTTESKT